MSHMTKLFMPTNASDHIKPNLNLQSLKKKCWGNLMAVHEFNPLPHCTTLIGVMLSTSLLVEEGEGYGLQKDSSYIHIIV